MSIAGFGRPASWTRRPHDRRRAGLATLVTSVAALAIGVYACGGDSGSSPTSPTTPTNPAPQGPTSGSITITISGGGANASGVDLAVGGTVTVTNNGTTDVEMSSDPHPAHTECPALNFGVLRPGQSRTSAPLTTVRPCGMHDHINPGTLSLQKTIAIR